MSKNNFPQVTLLVTHYNRSRSLERLLQKFDDLDFEFGDIVVSDDGSEPEHLGFVKELKDKYNFTLVTAPRNMGLGNNINKGQDAVKTPYTLYVQEDFAPSDKFLQAFKDSIEIMDNDKEIDIARYYGYFKYPYTKPYDKGFSKMLFKYSPLYGNHIKFYVYSDHPHLHRSDFLEKFGRYNESEGVVRTEFLMALSFIKRKGQGIFYDDYSALFTPKNTSEEPSTVDRAEWRQKQSFPILALRYGYLRVKLLKWTLEALLTK